MLSEQLLPRLFDKLPHEIDCLGRSLQHFLTEPLSILADLEPWMKFHNLGGVPGGIMATRPMFPLAMFAALSASYLIPEGAFPKIWV